MTRLEAYKRISGLNNDGLGRLIGRTGVQASRYCKPADDPGHNRPGYDACQALREVTYGVIHGGNYADDITPVEAASMMAEIARLEAAGASEPSEQQGAAS